VYSLLQLSRGLFVDNQLLINIREFQIITYLGHQLYTYLDVCYIDGEYVDIVWHRDTPCDILWQCVTSLEASTNQA